jgi:hypothetical protein
LSKGVRLAGAHEHTRTRARAQVSNFSEMLSGLATIRAFGLSAAFERRAVTLLDQVPHPRARVGASTHVRP